MILVFNSKRKGDNSCFISSFRAMMHTNSLFFYVRSVYIYYLNNYQHDYFHRKKQYLQCRHLIPAQVDRTSTRAWLYKPPWIICQKIAKHTNGPRSLRKLRPDVRSFMLCIHVQETGWQSGTQSCLMPGQPTHLV